MSKLKDVVNNKFAGQGIQVTTFTAEDNKTVSNNIHSNETRTSQNDCVAGLLICIDSNSRYIDFRKLWTLKGSVRKFIENLYELKKSILNEKTLKSVKHILINIGVNDLDSKSGSDVFAELKGIIEVTRSKYPGISIILGEITPRADNKDDEVKLGNNLINDWAKKQVDVFLAKHSNLRDPDWTMFKDTKHITCDAIPRFASNLKRAREGRERFILFWESIFCLVLGLLNIDF